MHLSPRTPTGYGNVNPNNWFRALVIYPSLSRNPDIEPWNLPALLVLVFYGLPDGEPLPMVYRAYITDHQGHFVRLYEIDAPDDATAVEQARKFAGGQDFDLWHRGRRIARIARQAQQPKSA